jgi:hypothetical protein
VGLLNSSIKVPMKSNHLCWLCVIANKLNKISQSTRLERLHCIIQYTELSDVFVIVLSFLEVRIMK